MVVDHSSSAALALTRNGPPTLTQAAGTGDYGPRSRLCYEMLLKGRIFSIAEKRANVSSKDWSLNNEHEKPYTNDELYVNDVLSMRTNEPARRSGD